MNELHVKANRSKIKMRSNLQFIVQFLDNINEIQTEIVAFNKTFINEFQKQQMLAKVSFDMKIDNLNAKHVLLCKIDFINITTRRRITMSIHQICLEIASKFPGRYELNFEKSFWNWVKNPTNRTHIERINNDLYIMEALYSRLVKLFNRKLLQIRETKASLESDLVKANLLVDKFLRAVTKKSRKYIEEMEAILDNITIHTGNLEQKLDQLLHILNYYNEQRSDWAQFLIGMKKTLSSNPKEVKLAKVVNLTNFAKDAFTWEKNSKKKHLKKHYN